MNHTTTTSMNARRDPRARILGLLTMLLLGAVLVSADAGVTRSRFDYDYGRFRREAPVRPATPAIERLESRWIAAVPPWHAEVLAIAGPPTVLGSDRPGAVIGSGVPGWPGTDPYIHDPGDGLEQRSWSGEDPDLTDNACGHSGQELFSCLKTRGDG